MKGYITEQPAASISRRSFRHCQSCFSWLYQTLQSRLTLKKNKSWKQRWIIRSMGTPTGIVLIQFLHMGRSALQQKIISDTDANACSWWTRNTRPALEGAVPEGHQTGKTSKRTHKNDKRCGKYIFDWAIWELQAKGMTWSQYKSI